MKEYLICIFGISLLSAVARLICAGSSAKRHMEMLTTLCIIATVASPLASFFAQGEGISELFDFDTQRAELNYEEIYGEYLILGNARTSQTILKEEIATLTGLSREGFDVELELSAKENGEVKITGATVYIYSEGISADPEIVTEHIFKRTGVECEIIYDKND